VAEPLLAALPELPRVGDARREQDSRPALAVCLVGCDWVSQDAGPCRTDHVARNEMPEVRELTDARALDETVEHVQRRSVAPLRGGRQPEAERVVLHELAPSASRIM
jgi:hypothetical protein